MLVEVARIVVMMAVVEAEVDEEDEKDEEDEADEEEEEEEVGSSELGSSGKVSLSEKVVLVLLAIEGCAVKEGSGSCHQGGFSVVTSRRVLSRACAINVCAIKMRASEGG